MVSPGHNEWKYVYGLFGFLINSHSQINAKYMPIIFRVASLTLGHVLDSDDEVTMKVIDKINSLWPGDII